MYWKDNGNNDLGFKVKGLGCSTPPPIVENHMEKQKATKWTLGFCRGDTRINDPHGTIVYTEYLLLRVCRVVLRLWGGDPIMKWVLGSR